MAGQLGDAEQRELLEAKLAEIDERRRKLELMSGFLQAKLDDLSSPG